MARHQLGPEVGLVTDVFSREAGAVLTVAPGDELSVATLDVLGHLERPRHPGDERPKMFPVFRGHCLAGPIAIEGARPGDLLAVHLRRIRPGPWGFTLAGGHETPLNRRLRIDKAEWLLWEVDEAQGTARCDLGYEVDLAPFLGIVGTLFLPVGVEGAWLYLGDGHAAQGDGEVAGTAIECPMTTDLVVEIIPEAARRVLHATTPAGRVTFGLSSNLNEAVDQALDAMVGWLQDELGGTRTQAMALASVAVDLRVTQVVNQTFGVHALWPQGRLRPAA